MLTYQEFRQKFEDRLCPFQFHIDEVKTLGIHNYSLATQVGYFELVKYLNDPNLFISTVDGWVMFRRGRSYIFAYTYEGAERFMELAGKKTVHVAEQRRQKYWGVLDETTYDMAEVLKPENYRHSELRRKVLRQPFKELDHRMRAVDMREPGMFELAKDINREWAEQKRSDPTLHQNTFPSARYIALWPRLLEAEKVFGPMDIFAHMYFVDDQPFGFKIGVIEGGTYHLMSSETRFWLPGAPKTSTWLTTIFFQTLSDDRPDVHTVNFGLAFEKGLRRWKAQWPHRYTLHYQTSIKAEA